MKRTLAVLLVILFALGVAVPAFAEGEHMCEHDQTSVESLHHCVVHAAEMGHITKAGIVTSLLSKIEASEDAIGRGDTNAAIGSLNAFIKAVKAQSGKSIDPEHAQHLIEHAANVIGALQ